MSREWPPWGQNFLIFMLYGEKLMNLNLWIEENLGFFTTLIKVRPHHHIHFCIARMKSNQRDYKFQSEVKINVNMWVWEWIWTFLQRGCFWGKFALEVKIETDRKSMETIAVNYQAETCWFRINWLNIQPQVHNFVNSTWDALLQCCRSDDEDGTFKITRCICSEEETKHSKFGYNIPSQQQLGADILKV